MAGKVRKSLPYIKSAWLVTKQPEAFQLVRDRASNRIKHLQMVPARDNIFSLVPDDSIHNPHGCNFEVRWKQHLAKKLSLSPQDHWTVGVRSGRGGVKVNKNQWKAVNLAYIFLVGGDDAGKQLLIKYLEAIDPVHVHNEASVLLSDLMAIHSTLALSLDEVITEELVTSIHSIINQRRLAELQANNATNNITDTSDNNDALRLQNREIPRCNETENPRQPNTEDDESVDNPPSDTSQRSNSEESQVSIPRRVDPGVPRPPNTEDDASDASKTDGASQLAANDKEQAGLMEERSEGGSLDLSIPYSTCGISFPSSIDKDDGDIYFTLQRTQLRRWHCI